jgi:hypothetical protein
MRYHYLRFDIWLCLLFSLFVSIFTAHIAQRILSQGYEGYVQKHTAPDGEIGGKAVNGVFHANSVEDLLSHDTFTVTSPGIEYRNRGAGYYGSQYLYALTLPSGELVAAAINMENVQTTGEAYTGEAILPVGRIVWEGLGSDKNFISQIEYKEPLSRKDFYIDMMGNGDAVSQDDYAAPAVLLTRALTVIICFPIFHAIGAKLGVFPPFLSRKKQASEWK